MSKQVELKGKSLVVRTREDYESALRVIIHRKGKEARVFYRIKPSLLFRAEDIDDIKDWNICGYRVEELVKFALILRDRRIEDVDLKDYNNCFFDGYKRAQEDFKASIEQSINQIIGGADNSS